MVHDPLFPSGNPTDSDLGIIFEQYKLAVEIWDRVRARRQQANALYLSINTALMGAAAIQQTTKLSVEYFCFTGLIICSLWMASILNYRSLANDKYAVIARLEELLPSAPFSAEATIGEKGVRSRRWPFTWVERFLPIVFGLLYVSVLLKPALPW